MNLGRILTSWKSIALTTVSNDVDNEVPGDRAHNAKRQNVSTTKEEGLGTQGRHQDREPFDVDIVKQRNRKQESEFEIVPKLK